MPDHAPRTTALCGHPVTDRTLAAERNALHSLIGAAADRDGWRTVLDRIADEAVIEGVCDDAVKLIRRAAWAADRRPDAWVPADEAAA
jgi:hypothetical protein